MRKIINSARAPRAVGPYSQAAAGEHLICISGQLPIEPETGEMASTLEGQVRQCMKNVSALAEEGGSDKDGILKCGLFIRDMKEFEKINSVYQEFFCGDAPARFVVEVSALPKNARIEIDAIAVK